ncbi:MAG TPA: PEP-CTERM sorting domain-containing protein [Phycisphaerae bacterium]|nr:PEP-CTERM sorting domain-containing protein [Phycisphaerae bacterium]
MFQSSKLPIMPAALLALAVAQVASAGVMYQISSPLVTAGTVNGVTYTSVALTYVNAAGFAVGNYSAGSSGQLVWVYNPTTATSSLIGMQADSGTYTGFNSVSGARAAAISPTGYVIGTASINSSLGGADAWVSAPGTAADPITGVVTPTIIGPITTLTDSNNYSTYYYYSAVGSRISSAKAVNDSGEVVGTSTRYTGTTSTTSVGSDAWLYTGSATPTLLGLGVSTNDTNYSGYRTINSVNYLVRTSTLIANSGNLLLPNATSINDSGVVVGMTNRYNPNATVTTSPPTQFGQDAWMYNYNNSGTTVQIGLVGGTYQNTTTAISTSNTTLTQFNPTSQVGGQTTRYSSTGTNIGTDAWIYTPSGTPSTSTSFSNGYVQVGLTDPAATGVIGHATTVSGNLFRSSLIVALNNSGQAAGTSSRYNSTSSTALGTDAFYDSGNGTSVNLSPTSPALTITGNTNSNYVNSSSTLTQTVVAMNNPGLVAGSLTRYSGSSNVGQDGWIYDPHNNTEFVLASPSVASTTDFGFVQIMAISDAGVAVGYYQSFVDPNTQAQLTVPTADYIFAWTEAGGLVTLDQINSIVGGSGGPATVTPVPGLNNALAGQTGWAALANSITTNSISINSPTLAVDGMGSIYGLGNTSSSTATVNNGAYVITAVPEPASLGLIGVGSLLMLRRRRH